MREPGVDVDIEGVVTGGRRRSRKTRARAVLARDRETSAPSPQLGLPSPFSVSTSPSLGAASGPDSASPVLLASVPRGFCAGRRSRRARRGGATPLRGRPLGLDPLPAAVSPWGRLGGLGGHRRDDGDGDKEREQSAEARPRVDQLEAGVVENARARPGSTSSTWIASTLPR